MKVETLIPKVRFAFDRLPNELVWTEGIQWHDKFLYESASVNTKLELPSSLTQLEFDHNSKKVCVKKEIIIPQLSAEGIARDHLSLIQLINESDGVLIYTLDTLEQMPTRIGATRGVKRRWGLCFDGLQFYLSNGSSELKIYAKSGFEGLFLDEPSGSLNVTLGGEPVHFLNTLEFANGFIYAAIRDGDESNQIVKIDLTTGFVVAVIEAHNLRDQLPPENLPLAKELNGIAYGDTNNGIETFFITGKMWSKIFEVSFVEVAPQDEEFRRL